MNTDISVLNRRPTILHLPPAVITTKDGEGNTRQAVLSSIPLTPGSQQRPVATVISREDWQRVQKHPAVKQWLTLGWIAEKPADVVAPTEVPPPDDLLAYSGPAAIALVETEQSEGTLRKWLAAEGRKPIKDAIGERLAALKAVKK